MKPGQTPPLSCPLPADWHTTEALFDHVPDTVFFVKDAAGHYVAVNSALVARCGRRHKSELLGRRVEEVYPRELGTTFAAQDAGVLRTGRPIHDHLELHLYAGGRRGWCLTTKLPLRDAAGRVTGLVGISRDVRAPGDRGSIPAGLVKTLEFIEQNFAEVMSPAQLARHAGLPPVRFARLIKRIFRLTPSQLITQTRLAAAAQALVETTGSIAEIAVACGFYDHSALSRAFRSATGWTPSQFRSGRGRALS